GCPRRPTRSRARTGSCCTGSDRRGTLGDSLEFLEPLGRPAEGLHLLGEGEADLPAAARRFQVEAAARHRGEPDVAHHPVSEADVILAEAADVGHHVVGTIRWKGFETGAVEDLEHEVPPLAVAVEQV